MDNFTFITSTDLLEGCFAVYYIFFISITDTFNTTEFNQISTFRGFLSFSISHLSLVGMTFGQVELDRSLTCPCCQQPLGKWTTLPPIVRKYKLSVSVNGHPMVHLVICNGLNRSWSKMLMMLKHHKLFSSMMRGATVQRPFGLMTWGPTKVCVAFWVPFIVKHFKDVPPPQVIQRISARPVLTTKETHFKW